MILRNYWNSSLPPKDRGALGRLAPAQDPAVQAPGVEMLPPAAVAEESAGVESAEIPVLLASLVLRDQVVVRRSPVEHTQPEAA
jgi:hypothetical protein